MKSTALAPFVRLFWVVAAFWHRIMAHAAPRMTSANPFYAQPNTFKYAPFFNRLDHVMAAGRVVTAIFTQQGADKNLVQSYRHNHQVLKNRKAFKGHLLLKSGFAYTTHVSNV